MYYRRANAAIIVYDITRQKSFTDAREWVKGQQLCSCTVGSGSKVGSCVDIVVDSGSTNFCIGTFCPEYKYWYI